MHPPAHLNIDSLAGLDRCHFFVTEHIQDHAFRSHDVIGSISIFPISNDKWADRVRVSKTNHAIARYQCERGISPYCSGVNSLNRIKHIFWLQPEARYCLELVRKHIE